MDERGYIEIKISGSKNNFELTPDNYDIKELMSLLANIENMFPIDDKKDRPTISYSVEKGSVKHIFKTSLIFITAFNITIGQVAQNKNIDSLNPLARKAFENIQNIASKRNYVFNIKTSLENSNEVHIDKNTSFKKTEGIWVNAEFYFYGTVTNAGGKDTANIHISTDNLGTVRIQTPINFLKKYEDNLLYKTLGVRATGKQHSKTGEIDTTSLKFVELVDYQPQYDESYLKALQDKAKQSWSDINADAWLQEIRGGGYGT